MLELTIGHLRLDLNDMLMNVASRILMRITEQYILLGGATFLNEHAVTVQTTISNLVGEVRPRGVEYLFLVIESILRSFPVEGASLLHSCGALKILIEACASSYFEEDRSEPDRVIILYLSIIARILVSSPAMLQDNRLLPVILPSGATFGEEELITLYTNKFQIAGNGAHGLLLQKMWALLLLSFYPPCQLVYGGIVLQKSNKIFRILIYMLKNVKPNGDNLLSYEVGFNEDEETVDIGADTYDLLQQGVRAKVRIASFVHKDPN